MSKVDEAQPSHFQGEGSKATSTSDAAPLGYGDAPLSVWMHTKLGFWYSVADEFKEEGDVQYVRADSHTALYEAAQKSLAFVALVYKFRDEDDAMPFSTIDYHSMNDLMMELRATLALVSTQAVSGSQ